MTSILFIAHFFPPTGGAGVQRSTKFAKYLLEHQIRPVVVTGRSNVRDRWSPEDETLLADVPAEIPVHRASWDHQTAGRSHGLGPRVRAYIEAGDEAIREHRPELILVTMSPFQDAAVASELSRRHGIPWVADLRDPWALDEFLMYRTFAHRWWEQRTMRRALAGAAGIIMNTPESRERLLTAFPEFREKRVEVITNGFDAEDFPEQTVKERNQKFRIVHTGTFHTRTGLQQQSRWMLNRLLGRTTRGVRVLPRSPYYLLRALEQIMEAHPERAGEMEVVFAGVMGDEDRQVIAESRVSKLVQVTGYVDHETSVRHLMEADLLFLPMHQVAPGEKASVVPGKTYEYIASGRPILGALPEGDVKDFVLGAGNCRVVAPDDVDGLAQGVDVYFHQWRDGSIACTRPEGAKARFDRRRLTGKLADFLDGFLKRGERNASAELVPQQP